MPRACGSSSRASGFRRTGSRPPRSGRNGPLVNRSDAEAWAQNRRVEFVITGVPGPTVAGGVEPTPVVAQPEPVVVGGVAVGPPPGEAQPPLVRTRPNLERDRRSRFYRDPLAPSVVRTTNDPDEFWVPRSSTWSAEWLGPASLEEIEIDGRIDSFVTEGDLRTAFPYTWVRLDLEPGFRVRLGDALQIYRPARVNRELGVVLRPPRCDVRDPRGTERGRGPGPGSLRAGPRG